MTKTLVVAGLAVALASAGCIASGGTTAHLDAEEGTDDVVIHLTVEDGRLVSSQAWWAEDAPSPELPQTHVEGLEAIVLMNDAQLEQLPLHGSADRAELWWSSHRVDATVEPGDELEANVVNSTSGQAVASFTVEIQP